MKITTFTAITVAVTGLAVGPAAFAQASGSLLYTPTIDLSAGPQNGHVGAAGGVFLTTYNYSPSVNWLGYFDKDGDGLANSHEVALWDGNNNLIAAVTVPAGTAAPLVNGYRWVALETTVNLAAGSWFVLGAQTDGVDTWGDLINVGNNQIAWNSGYFEGITDGGWAWSRAARYGSWPNPPGDQVGSDSIYPAANLGYNVVPEPTSLTLLGLGVVALLRRVRNRKS